MTRIDFYVLQQDTAMARLHFACRLAEKALNKGHHIVMTVEDEAAASNLSDYLWSFKPESFLPHQLQPTDNQEQPKTPAPIALAWDGGDDDHHDLLINLRHTVPEEFSRFKRVVEVVTQEPDCLAATRTHFQFYRDRGYPLQSHPVT